MFVSRCRLNFLQRRGEFDYFLNPCGTEGTEKVLRISFTQSKGEKESKEATTLFFS